MDNHPDGTPNPLNPMPIGNTNQPSSDEPAMGIGEFDFVETSVDIEPLEVAPTEVDTPTMPEETTEPETAVESIEIAEPEEAIKVETTESFVEPAKFSQPADLPEVKVSESVKIPVASQMPKMKTAKPTIPPVNNLVDPMMQPLPRYEEAKATADTKDEVNLVAKDSVVEPAGSTNKGKKILIGCGITFLILAIICGAAAIAILVLNNRGEDRVTRAIDRLLNGETSSIVAVKGRVSSSAGADYIEFEENEEEDEENVVSLAPSMKNLNIEIDGTFDFVSSMNEISAEVTAETMTGDEISIDIDELQTKSGDVFFKIAGLDSILTASDNTGMSSLNDSAMILSAFGGVFDTIDDEWIMANTDFGESMGELQIFDNSSACLVNAFGTLPKYSKDIANKYKANQFITYSTDKLGISKKNNPLYRLGFNHEKMSAFLNSLSNNGFVNELNACVDETATNSSTTVEKIEEVFKTFPIVYVEIDDNYNFTRIYFEADTEIDGQSSTTVADFNLSYPQKFQIEEPIDYINMSNIVNTLITGVLSDNGLDATE